MLSLVQYYLNAVKEQNYQTVASILQIFPHIKQLNIEGDHPLIYAVKENDPKLVEIFWSMLEDRNRFGKLPFTHKAFQFTHGTDKFDACEDVLFEKPEVVYAKTCQAYNLTNPLEGLSDDLFELQAEQLKILTGVKPEIYESVHNSQDKIQRTFRFNLPLTRPDLILNLKCALNLQGIPFNDEIKSKDSYIIELEAYEALLSSRVFETGDFTLSLSTATASDDFNQAEKIKLFEMCFENTKETQTILARFKESPLFYVYETKEFLEHLQSGFSAWIGQFAKQYLKGIHVPTEQLIEDIGIGHEQGNKEFLSKTLGLPTPNRLMRDLSGLSPVHKEILYEICFTPEQFIKNFVERIADFSFNLVDAQTLLRGEVERYQLAMNEHLPSKVHEDHLDLHAWQFRRGGHSHKGFTIMYDNPQARASTEQLNQDAFGDTKKNTMTLKH